MENKQKVKIAVIGVGNMGWNHLRIYSRFPNVEIRYIVDKNSKRARFLAEEHHVPYTIDYKKILKEVDAVSIATPTSTHFEIALNCLKAGKDILVEKPLTNNLKEAQILVECAKRKNLVLQVGHVERFNPAVEALTQIVDSKKIVFIEGKRIGPFHKKKVDTGVILDLMIHDLDIILDLCKDEVEKIYATGKSIKTQEEDIVTVQLLFKRGILVNLIASWIASIRKRELALIQPPYYIHVNYLNRTLTLHQKEVINYQNLENKTALFSEKRIQEIQIPFREPLEEELSHFIQCILKRTTPIVDGEKAFKVLQLAFRIKKALKLIK